MKKTFNRRVLLRGLGGAVVAAPFLSSVAEREAKAQGMTATAPKRLFVYFTHYGCLTDRWFPKLSHGALSKADYMGMQTLAPMAPYAEKLLMVRGIRAMNEWGFEGNYGQKNDPHTQVVGTYFTCHPVTPNNPGASGASNPGKFDCKPTGRSLDHIAAEQVNPKGQAPLLLQIGGVQGSDSNTMSVISWDQPGRIFPGQGSPMPVFSQLTGLFGTGTPSTMNPDTYKVVRGKSVIDCVRADLKRLQGVNMSGSDKKLLQDWVDLLQANSTGGPGGAVAAMCNMDTASSKLMLTADTVKAAGTDIAKVTNVMMDLAVLTALCDNNRIIFMKHPGNYTFKNLSLTMESHSISHRIGNAGQGGACVANAIEMIHTIDKYYAQCFAYLVGRLDMFSEGDKTLLDNSAAIWFQEMSDGNSHNLNNLPILQAGSMGGYFKTGWAVNVEKAKIDMSPGHSSEDCKNGQTPFNSLDAVGTPPDVASMPINKYYCNLLNGLGAKAGDDGWPLKGGTKPVTNFGKYDDTLLFKDGGTKDAIIKNPGEYPELRAS